MGQFEFFVAVSGARRYGVPYKDMTRPKRPRDTNQLAKLVVDVETGTREDSRDAQPMDEFARAGGLKGGRARAKSLSPDKRREIAREATAAR